MTGTDYTSTSQQTLMAVVDGLARHPLHARPVTELATDLHLPRAGVYRALRNLESADWAEQTPAGWRLAPGICRISERFRRALADLHHHYLADTTGPGDADG